MKKVKIAQLSALIGLFLSCASAMANSVAGDWIIVDDHTGKKQAIVRIEESNHELQGHLLKLIDQDTTKARCTACEGTLKNQPLSWLPILWGLKYSEHDIWDSGHMLDFQSGKVYRVKLKKEGNKLYVRKYVGIALFGHTHIWIR